MAHEFALKKIGCFIQPTALCELLETLGKDTLPDFGPKTSLTPKVLYNLYVKGARQQANDFVESARWCGLNPDYWGRPKIYGQCFLWLISSQWIGHLIQPHSPTRQQTNGLVESIRRCTYAASRSFNNKSSFYKLWLCPHGLRKAWEKPENLMREWAAQAHMSSVFFIVQPFYKRSAQKGQSKQHCVCIKEKQNNSSQSFLRNPSTLKLPLAHVCLIPFIGIDRWRVIPTYHKSHRYADVLGQAQPLD